MSAARKKGTAGENFFLAFLRTVFPHADRAPLKGTNDHGDYVNVPWLHEAKNTDAPKFLEWARTARNKAARRGSDRWVVMWKGDLRKADQGPYVLMPLPFYLEMVADHVYGPD